jgi:hypothetical protein
MLAGAHSSGLACKPDLKPAIAGQLVPDYISRCHGFQRFAGRATTSWGGGGFGRKRPDMQKMGYEHFQRTLNEYVSNVA